MKRSCKIGLITTLLLALVSLVVATPVLAVEPREGAPAKDIVATADDQPFLGLDEEDDDAARIKFGQNLLYAGNDVVNSALTDGLLFSFGNRMEVRGAGEYNIAAANILEVHGATEKDLFAAGNLVHLAEDAEIGRDVYLAGNEVRIESDLNGNAAITASKVTFKNVTIDGDVNLDAGQIIFGQNVKILGTLVYNENAQVTGLDSASIAHTETYVDAETKASAGELWLAQAIGAIGTFIVALILIIVFPKLKERIAAEANVQRFGIDFLSGLGFLALVPILSILLMISIFGMKAGLLLLAAWFLIVCLTGVFTGLWLGHITVEKLFRSRAPFVVEAIVGILLLGCLALVPGVNIFVSFFSVVFGTGLLISCVRPSKAKEVESIDKTPKPLENPFRGQSKKATTKSSAKKPVAKSAPAKVKKPGSTKATKPTRKPSQKK